MPAMSAGVGLMRTGRAVMAAPPLRHARRGAGRPILPIRKLTSPGYADPTGLAWAPCLRSEGHTRCWWGRPLARSALLPARCLYAWRWLALDRLGFVRVRSFLLSRFFQKATTI